MERNIKIECITLKKMAIGESNVGLNLLTENNEVLFVMAFGAAKPKSKLFEGITPFVFALWDLYFDPVKEHWRAKEVNINEYNMPLHSSIESFYTASFFSEVILKSQGSHQVFNLLKKSIELLANGNRHEAVLVQFMLRFLNNQGVLPSFEYCHKCEREINKESMYYIWEDELVCGRCLYNRKYIELNPGVSLYCTRTPVLPMENGIKIGLEDSSMKHLKRFLLELIKAHTEGKLLTLDSCDGLI